MIKRICKLMQAGVIIGVIGMGQAWACYVKNNVTYAFDMAGTGGGAGQFVTGLITFNGDYQSGKVNAHVYGRWYGHGECEMDWIGDYNINGQVMPQLAYTLTNVVATGPCVDNKDKTLIVIPSDNGTHIRLGVYNDGSHLHGSGELQDVPKN